MVENLSRRDFLKKTGKVALASAAALSFESILGCATFPEASREEVAQIKWDCNPILPIPKKGIYTGTNAQLTYPGMEVDKGYISWMFKRAYGLLPTFVAPGSGVYWVSNANFPTEGVKQVHRAGSIPLIRYIISPFDGFEEIIEGKLDDKIKRFASKAAQIRDPMVLVPFQGVNEPYWNSQVWPWSRGDPGEHVEAWIRMHDIMSKEGANKKVLWSTKMIAGGFGRNNPALDWASYTPPPEYLDIIGWNCNSGDGTSFTSLFHWDYVEAVDKYPTKPQVFWELGCYRNPNQARWMDKALTLIKEKYFWVKGINFDANYSAVGKYNPLHTIKTVGVVRKHFAGGYYIGNILPSKELAH